MWFCNEEAKTIFRNLDSWQRSKWVFPSGNPATHANVANLKRRFRNAVRRAEIPWCRWHDLRHCFASRLAMGNAPLGTIAAVLRHSNTELVRRYAHLSPSHLRDAVELVAGFGRDEKPESKRPLQRGTMTGTGTAKKEEVRHDA